MSSSLIKGLYAIVDNMYCPDKDHVMLARQFLEGGAPILQLRMKGEKDRSKMRQAAEGIMDLKKNYSFTFIVNDDVDLAKEIGADGVHGGIDDAPIREAREKLGSGFLIGYSSHSLKEAEKAAQEGADSVALGTIFSTPSKPEGHPIQGLETLTQVVQSVKIPVVAIGGIHRENIFKVLETGVQCVAMIGAITRVKSITEEVKWYCEVLKCVSA